MEILTQVVEVFCDPVNLFFIWRSEIAITLRARDNRERA